VTAPATTTCDNCREVITDFVPVNGKDWCELCAQSSVHCEGCGTLCDRNELVEVGRWVQKSGRRSWHVGYVEESCLLSWAVGVRLASVKAILR
jgi:hypothetical protein